MRSAKVEAGSILTAWRLHYNLPLTDPRVQDATDDEVVHDLLVLHFHRQKQRDEAEPERVAAEELASNPEQRERLVEDGRNFASSEDTLKRLRMLGAIDPPPPAPLAPRTRKGVKP